MILFILLQLSILVGTQSYASPFVASSNSHVHWQSFVNPSILHPTTYQENIQTFLSETQTRQTKIFISVDNQQLYIVNAFNKIIRSYPISTGLNGTGEKANTGKTPRGLHTIEQKVGHGEHPMQGFKARIPTQMYNPKKPGKDNILGRILVLDGQQSHNSNTKSRCIYIHGTGATWHLGKVPHSRGCVRMDPHHIVELFDIVEEGTPVYIHDSSNPLPWEKAKNHNSLSAAGS